MIFANKLGIGGFDAYVKTFGEYVIISHETESGQTPSQVFRVSKIHDVPCLILSGEFGDYNDALNFVHELME